MHDLVEFDRQARGALGVAEEQITTGFEVFEELLDELRPLIFAEVNQHVHAEDAVEASHVNGLRQVHGREADYAAQLRLHHVLVADLLEIGI